MNKDRKGNGVMTCTCVYATSENTPAVRKGHEAFVGQANNIASLLISDWRTT